MFHGNLAIEGDRLFPLVIFQPRPRWLQEFGLFLSLNHRRLSGYVSSRSLSSLDSVQKGQDTHKVPKVRTVISFIGSNKQTDIEGLLLSIIPVLKYVHTCKL